MVSYLIRTKFGELKGIMDTRDTVLVQYLYPRLRETGYSSVNLPPTLIGYSSNLPNAYHGNFDTQCKVLIICLYYFRVTFSADMASWCNCLFLSCHNLTNLGLSCPLSIHVGTS